MANHCYNYGYFIGNYKDVKRLFDRAKKVEETDKINEYKPVTPKWAHIRLYAGNYSTVLMSKPDLNKDGSFSPNFDVYDKYGSKWFEGYFELQDYHDEEEVAIVISGDSAWSPVLSFFAKICKKYNLTCGGNYEESGMNFAGDFSIDAQGNISEEQMTYRDYEQKNNPESYFDNILHSIQDGYYEDLESVYSEFNADIYELDDHEKEELKETFERYQSEQENK